MAELVALVYRSDWRQLSLSATISRTFDSGVANRLRERRAAESRQAFGPLRPPVPRFEVPDHGQLSFEERLLLAPGGRYRIEGRHGSLDVSDGEHSWSIYDGAVHRGLRSPGARFHGLLTPRWLIASYQLHIVGSEVAGDRTAIRVIGVPRPPSARRPSRCQLLDRVEVLVDAEFGILLRSRQVFEGQTLESAELRDLVINPPEAGTPGLFVPPPDVPVDEEEPFADVEPPSGTGWEVAGAAAGAAASALGFAVKHAPRRKTVWPTDDEEPDMPADAALAPGEWEQGEPPDDRILNLLHRTGLPPLALSADVHEWIDVQPLMENFETLRQKLPAPLAGILGPDSVWAALGERATEDGGGHRVARLAVRMPGRYRLDYLSGDWNKRYTAIGSDGEQTTKLFDDRVATGPVRPLEPGLASMLDPAWLLQGWRLTVIGPINVAGRDGINLRAVTDSANEGAFSLSARADLVLDTKFGILLRYTTYADDRPATRTELRNLRPLDEHTSFRIEPRPGQRSVTDSGGPFGDRNLPSPAEAAATAATIAAAGAVAFTGWLEKHRARRPPK